MSLNYRDSQYILSKFPPLKLSYEKKIHNKVFPMDIVLTIPKGKKYFAWFCKFKNKPTCVFLELDNYRKNIKSIFIANCCFNPEITINMGTILFGTIFTFKKVRCFNIENIFYFRNKNISNCNEEQKFKYIDDLMNNYIRQTGYNKNDIIFGLPIIEKKRENLINKIGNLPYDIYCIQHRSLYQTKHFLNEIITFKTKKKILIHHFLVKAEVGEDIYSLYLKDNGNLELYETALIPDFNTSFMMNGIFRNIKENLNLDALEESDDEEEFEDISIDKHVNLEKEIIMECVYKKVFKSWVPVKISKNKEICKKTDLFL
jgi:hypothetical protein